MDKKLDQILALLNQLMKGQVRMSQEADDLLASVKNSVTVEEGLLTLYAGMRAKLDSNASDVSKLGELRKMLDDESAKVTAAALTANTAQAGPTPISTDAMAAASVGASPPKSG